jgi:hypothetical protein
VEHEHVFEEGERKDSVEPELRKPQALSNVPVGAREILGAVSPSLLKHCHTVALLSEPQGRDAPTEPRSNDYIVVIEFFLRLHGILTASLISNLAPSPQDDVENWSSRSSP